MSEPTEKELAVLRQIAASLQELVDWARIAGRTAVTQVLETTLDSDSKRLVYHLMDGHRGVAEIESLSGVNRRYVSEWGQEWEDIGIVRQSTEMTVKGRRQKIFDLARMGISIPRARTSSEELNGK